MIITVLAFTIGLVVFWCLQLSSSTTHSIFSLPSASPLAGQDSLPGGMSQFFIPGAISHNGPLAVLFVWIAEISIDFSHRTWEY